MAKAIYKLFMVRLTEAAYQLSPDELNSLLAKVNAARESVGGKVIAFCDSSWASEQWHNFGVEEFPDIDAEQKYTAMLAEMNWFRYVESVTLLGTAYQPQAATPVS